MNNWKLTKILDAVREHPPVVLQPPQGDLKHCEVTYRAKEVTIGPKTYKPTDIVVASAEVVRPLVEKGLLVVSQGGYCATGLVRVGNGTSLPAYSPWRSEPEKDRMVGASQSSEYSHLLVRVRLLKQIQVINGGVDLRPGAEFFVPFRLCQELGFRLETDPVWPTAPLLLLESSHAPATTRS
jgi:hypothetical protein